MRNLFFTLFPILTLLLGFLLGCLKDLVSTKRHRTNLQLMLYYELKRNLIGLEALLKNDGFFQRSDRSITVGCLSVAVANLIPFMKRNVFDQYLGTIHSLNPSIVESLLTVYETQEHLSRATNAFVSALGEHNKSREELKLKATEVQQLITLWHHAASEALSSMSIAQKYKDEIQKGVGELLNVARKNY